MPKVELIKNSFIAGEISPFLLGRSDIAKYHQACESLINFFVRVEGSAQRRWGTRYIIDTTGPDRLIPFTLSVDQKYILEFGRHFIQFYVNEGQIQIPGAPPLPPTPVPYQVGTPYELADLWEIHYAQNISVMYLCHPDYPPAKLIRLDDTNWVYFPIVFNPAPAIQQDQDIGSHYGSSGANITITGGDIITASTPCFIAGDIGKAVVAGSGIAFINAFGPGDGTATDGATGATLHTQVVTTVTNPFDQTTYAKGKWFLRGSPNAFFSPGFLETIPGTGGAPDQHYWHGQAPVGFGGGFPVRTTTKHPTDSSWQTSTGTANVKIQYNDGFTDCFRTIDVGSYINFAGGYGQINTVTDSTSATVTMFSVPTAVEQNAWGNPLIAPTPPGGWWFEQPAFGPGNYPHAVCLYGDRLYFAGTKGGTPNTVWGSNVGDYENFALSTLADGGIRFTVNSSIFEHIHSMTVFQGSIVASGSESEYIINGGSGQQVFSSGAPITPQNINVIKQSQFGAADIQPQLIDNDLIFIQKAGFNAYRFAFDAVSSSFGSTDLNILNSIITTVGFKEFCYQQRPFKILWFTTTNNQLLGMTYDKTQDVFAWHRHFTGADTGDSVISIADISTQGGAVDEVWMLVQRTREAATRWSIEIMDSSMLVDCGLRTVFSHPVSSVSGLSYLSGRYVTGNANGIALPSVLMGGDGVYTFPTGFTATTIQIGLQYNSHITTVRPEPRPTIQGLFKRWLKLWARLYNTVGLYINNQEVYFLQLNTLVDIPNPPITGDVQVNNLGFDRDGRVIIEQLLPLPSHILCVFGSFEVGEIG